MAEFHVIDDLKVERVGETLLVLPPRANEVLQLQGLDAEAFELAERGVDVVPGHLAAAMAGLVELGLVQTDAWSRRRVLQLGGAAAAAAVTVVALPSVAAAASGTGTTTPPAPRPAIYLIGGGGGGGRGSDVSGGGGGGGGAQTGPVSFTFSNGAYVVTVGAGGTGATPAGNGGPGS
ncbi:MAG: hypothetical protein JST73_03325, partial [Actinobacteria bacterium]|nr:hypothetical protein [Actinomycetota bacterium]